MILPPTPTYCSRRTFLVGIIKFLLTGSLVGRLYFLQIQKGHQYKTLSDDNRTALRFIPPPRGRLLDRKGRPLALNITTFQALLLVDKVVDLQQTIQRLGSVIDMSHLDPKALLCTAKKKRSSLFPLMLKERLTWEEVTKLETNPIKIPGVIIEKNLVRFYPFSEKIAHFLGHVGYPTPQEVPFSASSVVMEWPVGKLGVEKIFNKELQGQEGLRSLEVNAARHVVRQLWHQPPQEGPSKQLHLDQELQCYVHDQLQEYPGGACVVMDLRNGGLLALASTPGFDPNIFSQGIPHPLWQSIINNPSHPLVNKPLAGLYPPGSVLKMVVALAALEAGVITPSTTVVCRGHLTLNKHPFHCHMKEGHGPMTVYEAIKCSCDVFFYDVSLRTGIDRMLHFLRIFGLGERFMPFFPEEKEGLLPTPQWKKKNRSERWTPADTLLTSIGQGFVLANPLQIAVMTGRLATGRRILPFLAPQTTPPHFPLLPVNPHHLQMIQYIMHQTVNGERGTSRRAQVPFADFQVAGKTGTSQVRRITLQARREGRIKARHYPWKERDHAIFCGYAPFHSPRYSLSVVVEHGGSGGMVAGPLGANIFKKLYEMEKESPPSP